VTKRGYEVAVAFEFFFDCSSPWTYLACGRVQKLANRTVANLVLRPSLRRGVFNKVNANVDENRKLPRPTGPRDGVNARVGWQAYRWMRPTLWCKASLNSDGSTGAHSGKPHDRHGITRAGTASFSAMPDGDVMNCHKESTAFGDQKPFLAKARVDDMKADKTNIQILASKACSKTRADFVARQPASGHGPLDAAQGAALAVVADGRLVCLETRLRTRFLSKVRNMVNAPDDVAEVAAREIGIQKMEENSWA
jgi:hypothetical protein